jgi:putative ABC transport system permease protein
MCRNYLVVAFRNLLKTKVISLVNIGGLVIGIASCLLILHYVSFELSYDRFHQNSDRIYRLRYDRTDETGHAARFASCCPPAAARIRGNYPEVEKIGRMLKYQAIVSHDNTKFLEERIFFAEPQVLEILKFPFVSGDPLSGLSEPDNAFISQSTAKKYFGDRDPVGEVISTNKTTDYKIVGIFDDIPENSHLKFDILLPWKNLAAMFGPEYTEAWGHTGSYTYLLARPGTDPDAFERKLRTLAAAEAPWLKDYNMTVDLAMQPLTAIHLNSHFMQEYEPNGNRNSVDILFIIAVFILLMAWVNYVNLSTAGSLNRAKEVGLRKVVGASRRQLITQFFVETLVTNVIAIFGAIILIALVLPTFNRFTGVPIENGLWTTGWIWAALAIVTVGGILISGFHPAMAMSSFEPVAVMKGVFKKSLAGLSLRKVLVVFQFATGLVLIIATLIIYRQITFMRSQELGFNMDQMLVVTAPRVRGDDYAARFDTFKETLLQRVNIEKVSHVTEVPGKQIYWDAGGIHRAGSDLRESKNYHIVGVDYDFADVFDLELAAGRTFSRDFPSDKDALVLNEAAVPYMGFDDVESTIGQEVDYWGDIYPIIGVLRNYHQQSPKEAFTPHIYRFMPYGRGTMGMIAIQVSAANVKETIEAVRQDYDRSFPGNSFDYFFLDDYYNQQYQSDQLFARVCSLFSLLAVFMTALGTYGLSSFATTQLTKEIGIRKVLGASVPGIIRMLTREFTILLLIANIVAWPIAYFAMSQWLTGYAYRTAVGIEVFLVAGFLTVTIALLSVFYQVIKTARANPVEAIRYE